MLTVAQIRLWAKQLEQLAVDAVAKMEPALADVAEVAELVDPIHAPLYAGVAALGASINNELHELAAGQETVRQAIMDVIPGAIEVWRESKTAAAVDPTT